jgi:leader peptidase (prepilin peptidase)/N-methyltransferase
MIAWYDNIPLLSFLVLRARCRRCDARISPRYFLVELLTAVLFLLVWLRFQALPGPIPGIPSLENLMLVLVYWLAVGGLILGTFVDFEHMIIPDRVSLGGIGAGLALSLLVPAMQGVHSHWGALARSAVGAGVGFGLLWTVGAFGKWLFRKDAMGFGDVKLMGAIGAFLGWQAVLFSVMLSSLIGSIVGVALVLTGRKQMQSRIPYGPYLALAAVVWILWGAEWWRLYVAWLAGEPY